ncbi:MAG: amino acid permease [Proteobacteria bacterium]|nr:MAG: amino acid permease [Pseudomonadota bacterium]
MQETAHTIKAADVRPVGRPQVRLVSTITATAIVVADMIGVGVFTSLGFQVQGLPSGFSLLLLWVVGGAVALCGVFSYGELTAMFPRSSGEYNLLRQAYHPAVGFLAGWLSATVGFAAPVALAAMAFGGYGKAILPGIPPLALGLGVVWVVTLIGLRGIHHSSVFQMIWTALKVVLILAFLVAGFALATPQPISFAPSSADASLVISAPFAISLVFVMYSYSGWNAATYIVGEMDDPQRGLPRSLVVGTSIVIALYVALNALFLYATPVGQLAGQLDVAVIAGKHIFGDFGGRIVGGLICIGLVSSISAMMWIGPRVTTIMGEDVPMLRLFARRSQNGVPIAAVLFQAVVATLMLLTQSFEAVLEFIQFSLLSCSFLTVLGVIKLRIMRPDLPRPYRAWGYPVTPLVFLAVTAFMMYYLVTQRPLQSFIGVLMMASGLAVYYLSRSGTAPDLATPT